MISKIIIATLLIGLGLIIGMFLAIELLNRWVDFDAEQMRYNSENPVQIYGKH